MATASVDNFTNDSAMMIAWERALETKQENALFGDPFAMALAGSKGETLSANFTNMAKMFEFDGWPDFHRAWVAVRTRFIDDRVRESTATGKLVQLVNLGAGMDTRALRLECYKTFTNGAFDVDMAVVQNNKRQVFEEFLGAPTPHCPLTNIDLDFNSEDATLETELGATSFEAAKPTLFLSEGLIMYLGATGKFKLIKDVSAMAAPGSVFVLQFMDASESEFAKANPGSLDNALSREEATKALTEHGWVGLEFWRFGEPGLNYGRFPTDKFKPSASFSFCVCTKT